MRSPLRATPGMVVSQQEIGGPRLIPPPSGLGFAAYHVQAVWVGQSASFVRGDLHGRMSASRQICANDAARFRVLKKSPSPSSRLRSAVAMLHHVEHSPRPRHMRPAEGEPFWSGHDQMKGRWIPHSSARLGSRPALDSIHSRHVAEPVAQAIDAGASCPDAISIRGRMWGKVVPSGG